MTIFCLNEGLAIRVGRQGIWIWAPSVSAQPIFLDPRRLEEMGLSLAAEPLGRSPVPIQPAAASRPPGNLPRAL